MSGITQTTRVYPLSDFPTGECNAAILKQQIVADGLVTTPPASVVRSGSSVAIMFDALITSAEVAQLDVLVAAHQGSTFQTLPIADYSEADASDDTGSEISKLTVTTNPLPAGVYLVSWFQELSVTTNNGTTGCRGRLNVTKNGGAATERAQENTGEAQWQAMSGALSISVADGETYEFELSFQRIGTSGNAAKARRARITLAKLS